MLPADALAQESPLFAESAVSVNFAQQGGAKPVVGN
jgi:hypothetical protein